MVEKRLLSRFRDRNPSPLDNLDVVSEETYLRLVQLGEQVENAQERLDVSAKDLGCAAGLVALLARYRFQLSSKDHTLLLAHLFPNVAETDDQVRRTSGHERAVVVMSKSRACLCSAEKALTPCAWTHGNRGGGFGGRPNDNCDKTNVCRRRKENKIPFGS